MQVTNLIEDALLYYEGKSYKVSIKLLKKTLKLIKIKYKRSK